MTNALNFASLDDIYIDRELGRRSLREFIKIAWPLVEPAAKFIPCWHIDAIAEHLEAVVYGEITRLVINVPPGSTKSLSCCVFFPTWAWIQDAGKKFIFGSYSDRISLRDGRRTRRLLQSDWFQDRWGNDVILNNDETAVAKFSTTAGGFRMATTVAGGVTGEHADIQVVDDPIKPFDVSRSMYVAKNALDAVKVWWNETMSSRLTSFDKSARIIIMQRLHESDLAGEVLKEAGYEHLMLPMEFVPARKCFTSIGFEDPRKEAGELLAPERFPAEAVKTLKKDLGSRGAEAQLQQDPTPAEGTIIKSAWFKHYHIAPRKFTMMIQSWDCTFKGADTSDYVVGQVWGVRGEEYYLLDQIRERMSFTETCKAVKKMTVKWPKAVYKLVEAKANGEAVVDVLRKKIAGFKLIEPKGGKEARCNAVEPLWESGAVYVPHPDLCPWIDIFETEITGFPSSAHDDQVDGMTQALVFLQGKRLGRFKQAMENVR